MRISSSNSCFPAASAPIELIWVCSPTASRGTIGSVTGVRVDTTSQPATSATEPARTSNSPANRSTNCAAAASSTSVTTTSSMGRTVEIASNWVTACTPAPTSPSDRASGIARWSVATAAAAPVRFFVNSVPSITASGKAVSGSEYTTVPITVGMPNWSSLSGWTFTHFRPAASHSPASRYAGIDRKSPLY